MRGPDLRLVPLAGISWLLAWGVTGGLLTGWGIVGAAVGLVAVACLWRRPVMVAVAVIGTAVLLISWARVDRLAAGAVAELARQDATVRAEGTLRLEPRLFQPGAGRPAQAIALVDLIRIEGRGRTTTLHIPVKVVATGEAAARYAALPPGSLMQISGTAHLPDTGDSVAAILRTGDPPVVLRAPGGPDAAVNRVRGALRDAMTASPPDQAALVPSLVVGDTSAVTDEMAEKFRRTALTHLLAVSGSNLTLLLAFLLVTVKWAGLRGWAVRVVAVLGVAVFILICRAEPSVLRAAAMGTVALAALGAGRDRARGIRHLCVAVMVLLMIDPWLARTWGFALSATASAGILLWANRWQEAMGRWAPNWLSDAICIPLAAQLATQPLITALSGQISAVGLLANAAVGVFIAPATILGMLAAIAGSFLPAAGIVFGWLAGWAVQPVIWGAEIGSSLPAASWTVGSAPQVVVLVAGGCLLLAATVDRLLRYPIALPLLVVMLLAASVWRPHPIGWPGDWDVVFCDVGQGDATVLRAGPGQAVLVDVGPDNGAAANCLGELGIQQVPLLVLTHYHADHIGGLAAVLERARVGTALVSRTASPGQVAAAIRARLAAVGTQIRTAQPGEMLQVGRVGWSTVSAGNPAPGDGEHEQHSVGGVPTESSAENDSSVIGVADIAGLRVMLAGDAEVDGQHQALRSAAGHRLALHSDVLKLPHHGSARQDREFFVSVGASLAVASAGQRNDYGHPAARTLNLAGSLGMAVNRTDTDGAVAVAKKPDGLAIRVRGP